MIKAKLTAAFGVPVHWNAGDIMGAPGAKLQDENFIGMPPPSLNEVEFSKNGAAGGAVACWALAVPTLAAKSSVNMANNRTGVIRIPFPPFCSGSAARVDAPGHDPERDFVNHRAHFSL